MESNIFIQDGHQNMWTQYSDNFTIRNNIFIGGTLGINSTINNQVYHNIFYRSGLRYDAHLTNHPLHGDYYKQQDVRIKNNVIIESAITMPDDTIVDWNVFSVENNYYNIENSWLRSSWGSRGVGFDDNSILLTDHEELIDSFVQPPVDVHDNYDFHLLPSSPCVNAGLGLGITDDIEGNVRDPAQAPDIGAYEWQSPVLPGDVNGDEMLNLLDVITTLQVLMSFEVNQVELNADVNDDRMIGMAEAIMVLEAIAE
jgi:hypothetical protein